MLMSRIAAAAALMLIPLGMTWAEPRPEDSVAAYHNEARQEWSACSESFWDSTRATWLHPPDLSYRACISRSIVRSNASYDAALRSVSHPASREALRQYHFAFLSALKGIEPRPGESADAYEERQDETQHVLAHAWFRFEVAEPMEP